MSSILPYGASTQIMPKLAALTNSLWAIEYKAGLQFKVCCWQIVQLQNVCEQKNPCMSFQVMACNISATICITTLHGSK